MKIFGTHCSFCGRFQLATEFQLGMNVKCSFCLRDFICVDETGFLSFAKSSNEAEVFKFDKKITNAFFTYGIGIPASMHDIVRIQLSKNIELGNDMSVKLRINQIDFPVQLRYFENYRKELCLHLLWLNGSKLKQKLIQEYREQYEYFVIDGEVKGKKSWKVSVSLSDEEDVFILDEDKYGSKVSTTASSKGQKKRSGGSSRDVNIDLLLG